MIFLLINITITLFLILFSKQIDAEYNELKFQRLANLVVDAFFVSLLLTLTILVTFINNEAVTGAFTTLTFFVLALFSIDFMLFCFQFPNYRRNAFLSILKTLLLIGAFYVVFIKVKYIGLNDKVGLLLRAPDFIGPFNWGFLYLAVIIFGLPLLGIISLLLRIMFMKGRLVKQQIVVTIGGVFLFWAFIFLLFVGIQTFNPKLVALLSFAVFLLVMIVYKGLSLTSYYDAPTLLMETFKGFVNYLFPALLSGVAIVALLSLRETNRARYVGLFLIVSIALFFGTYYIVKFTKRRFRIAEREYANALQEGLAALDYNETSAEVSEAFFAVLQDTVQVTALDVLIEINEKEMVTAYSSGEKVKAIQTNPELFDVLLNADRPVVFKSHIMSQHALSSVGRELMEMFEELEADAIIFLHQGRSVFGAIVLGPKRLGNIFNPYDYTTFLDLYSHFFVYGYYMMNIAKEAIIGTVSRELQFSGQIIQSIQENVDIIENPKADIGHLSTSAHNLGGEFIDFIRLTDDRYIAIMGDMSGKGIDASMSMVIVKSLLRTFLTETNDFKELVQKVNYFIRMNLPKGTFMAGIFLLIDFADNVMYYVNCGVPALFMYNQTYNNVIEIQGDGKVLGFVKDISSLVKVKKIALNPGDVIVGCTDGLIDAKSMRGEAFGKERIQKSIIENLSYPSDRMVTFMKNNLLEFTSRELEDDVSILAIKYLSR